MTGVVQRVSQIGRNVEDLDRAVALYRDALGFRVDDAARDVAPAWARLPGVAVTPSRCALLSLGAQQIALTEFRDAAPYPANSTSSDLCFQHCAIVVNDMPAAYARLTAHDAMPISRDGPQLLPPSTGSVTAFKFRDPDGHPLELIHFPPGCGDPAWQIASSPGPTLGIDHSAISIGDIERSIAFYALLGLQLASRGVNRGVEQQNLDALEDVDVEVAALHAAASNTPHLELLCYQQPRGRIAPRSSATSIAADRLVWHANAVEVLIEAIIAADFVDAVVSSGLVDGMAAALLRDPDGHLLVLQESGLVTS